MHVRGGEFVAQDEESIDLDGRVRLHPVLPGTERVWRLAPSAFATGVAGRICGDNDITFRQAFQDEREEPLQQRCPAPAGHRTAEYGMIWHVIESEIPLQHVQQTFRVAEGRSEELLDQEPDHHCPFIGRGSTDPLPALPERERIDVLPDSFHGQLQSVRLDLGASTEVDAEGVEARLTVKLEYFRCYFNNRGVQSSHLSKQLATWIGPHLNIL